MKMKCPKCGVRDLSYATKRCRACMSRDTAVRRAISRSEMLVQEVARDAGISVATVLRAARGTALGRSAAVRLASVLGIDAAVVVLGEGEGS